jgi:hypothetical protein
MKNVVVELEWHELDMVAHLGVMRRINSIQRGRKDQHLGPSDWSVDIESVAGELAFAKYLGVYCVPRINVFKAPDVVAGVAGYQVRSTRHQSGHLIIRPKDGDDEPYILTTTHALTVAGETPRVTVVAMLSRGGLAKCNRYINREGDSWWVPQQDLIELPVSDQGNPFGDLFDKA